MFVMPSDGQIDSDADANRTIGHIKGRPVVTPECEVEKIHHMTIAKPVDYIADNSTGDQSDRDLVAQSMDLERAIKDGNHDEGDR